MMSCFIVDDELFAIDVLKKHIEQTPGLKLSGAETSPIKALRQIRNNPKCTVVFLDIDMKELSGMELAKLLKDKVHIVFTTGHPDYAVGAFDLGAVDYLVKPVTYTRFLKAIERVEQRAAKFLLSQSVDDFFFIQDANQKKIVRIRYKDIEYIESQLNYLTIHCSTQKYMTYSSTKELEEFLPEQNFLRIHKSFIINIEKIINVDGNMIKMENGSTVSLGESYRKHFFEIINAKMFKKK